MKTCISHGKKKISWECDEMPRGNKKAITKSVTLFSAVIEQHIRIIANAI
jgi:hypothetical protein